MCRKMLKVHILCIKDLWLKLTIYDQGPVVKSVVSLTSSLRVISLTVLADSIYNILIFFAMGLLFQYRMKNKIFIST